MQHAEQETQPVNDITLWSTKVACQKLGGIHRPTLYRLVENGKLKAVKVGGRRMIVAASVRKYIEGQLTAE
jgi:excisionase family DNA binding protein